MKKSLRGKDLVINNEVSSMCFNIWSIIKPSSHRYTSENHFL